MSGESFPNHSKPSEPIEATFLPPSPVPDPKESLHRLTDATTEGMTVLANGIEKAHGETVKGLGKLEAMVGRAAVGTVLAERAATRTSDLVVHVGADLGTKITDVGAQVDAVDTKVDKTQAGVDRVETAVGVLDGKVTGIGARVDAAHRLARRSARRSARGMSDMTAHLALLTGTTDPRAALRKKEYDKYIADLVKLTRMLPDSEQYGDPSGQWRMLSHAGSGIRTANGEIIGYGFVRDPDGNLRRSDTPGGVGSTVARLRASAGLPTEGWRPGQPPLEEWRSLTGGPKGAATKGGATRGELLELRRGRHGPILVRHGSRGLSNAKPGSPNQVDYSGNRSNRHLRGEGTRGYPLGWVGRTFDVVVGDWLRVAPRATRRRGGWGRVSPTDPSGHGMKGPHYSLQTPYTAFPRFRRSHF